jgi:hypothetical protein
LVSERAFLEGLWTLCSGYKRALETAIAEGSIRDDSVAKMIPEIFGNATDILNFNTELLLVLQEAWKKWPGQLSIGDAFLTRLEGFKIYSSYINGYDKAVVAYRNLIKKSGVKQALDVRTINYFISPLCLT